MSLNTKSWKEKNRIDRQVSIINEHQGDYVIIDDVETREVYKNPTLSCYPTLSCSVSVFSSLGFMCRAYLKRYGRNYSLILRTDIVLKV